MVSRSPKPFHLPKDSTTDSSADGAASNSRCSASTTGDAPAIDPAKAAAQAGLKKVRTRHFQSAKENGIKIVGLTSYDQLSAGIFDKAGIDFLLVGDSAAEAFARVIANAVE